MKKRIPVLKSVVCALSLTFSVLATASAERPVLPLPSAEKSVGNARPGIGRSEPESIRAGRDSCRNGRGSRGISEMGGTVCKSVWKICRGRWRILSQVSPDGEVRKNADACSMDVQRFITEFVPERKTVPEYAYCPRQ